MKQYPEHYSSLRFLGSGAVSALQDYVGSGVYFNPFVELNGLKIKYGVVNIDTLLSDLQGWETLYLAGRLHKPVKILRDEPKVRFVNQANLISVLRTSLLLLPEKFNEFELYKMIAGISYMGDPRMQFGENPNKVHNIVSNQFLNFRKLYSPLMDDLPNLSISSGESQVVSDGNQKVEAVNLIQDMSPLKRGNMVFRLPSEFRSKIYARYASKLNSPELAMASKSNSVNKNDPSVKSVSTDFDRQIADDKDLSLEVARAIRYTVSWPSLTQSAKGLLTAGLVKSMKYSYEKISKYRLGKQAIIK
ncbi:Tam41p [Sugiyamaella lignohabitans]|uniref:Phosphatidate cytidylyltransferase, mitochondrial n=1 Tax=Sugiyamaella lignohabitans TaxID=796027 RepID=A0A161HGY3_9ASCO|nr:Tam41p [Sugiyamaella lignohabitans]ANB11167.1 Tam41p [Sugiyamaella lignohabitans]